MASMTEPPPFPTSSSATTTLLHKILIPVITTVLGATAIYFLGFNKKTSDPEKATVSAWQTFVTSQNISYKNINSLTDEYKEKLTNEVKERGISGIAPVLKDYKNEIFKVTDQAREDVNIILKNEDVDEAFVSMLKRYLANSNDDEKKVDDFFDDLISLTKSNLSDEEKGNRFTQEAAKFGEMGKRADERAANEAEEIAQALSKKYNRPFDLNDLKVYVEYKKEKDKKKTDDDVNVNNPVKDEPVKNGPAPPDPDKNNEIKDNTHTDNNPVVDNNTGNDTEPTTALLTGQWQMTGGVLELSKNGDMYWSFDAKGYTSGDWKLTDGKLRMNATNPDTKKTSMLIGFLSNVTNNSFTLTFMTSPKEVYNFKRKN